MRLLPPPANREQWICISEIWVQTFVSEAISKVAVNLCTSSCALSSSSLTSLSCWRKFITSRCNSFRSLECSSCIAFSRSFRKATRQHRRVMEQLKGQERKKNHKPLKHPYRTKFLMIPFSLYLFSVDSNPFQFADERCSSLRIGWGFPDGTFDLPKTHSSSIGYLVFLNKSLHSGWD